MTIVPVFYKKKKMMNNIFEVTILNAKFKGNIILLFRQICYSYSNFKVSDVNYFCNDHQKSAWIISLYLGVWITIGNY